MHMHSRRDEREKREKEKKGSVPSVSAPVLAGPNAQHHPLVSEHCGHGVHAAGECLPEKNDVRSDALVLYAQQLARPRKTLSDPTYSA